MNKKLFALLTSAAVVAACAPSVFAAEDTQAADDAATTAAAGASATLEITPAAETVAAGDEATFDVAITADQKLCTVQFAFTADNGEITGFTFNEDNVKNTETGLAFDDWGYNGKMTDEDKEKFKDNEDYQVMAYDKDFDDEQGVVPNKLVIGTLTVKAAADAKEGDVINVSTSTAKIAEGGIANYNIDEYAAWSTVAGSVTVAAATESSESVVESTGSTVDSTSSTSSSESTSSESSKTTTNTSSKSTTNNTTNNTNTGAASTAAVALAASAAALVVISKKRK